MTQTLPYLRGSKIPYDTALLTPSDQLVATPVPEGREARAYYLDHFAREPGPVLAISPFVPTELAEHLMRNKRDSALGALVSQGHAISCQWTYKINEVDEHLPTPAAKWVDRRSCLITNMEGALHTFVTALVPIRMHGDYKFGPSHRVVPFPDVNNHQQARPVILSTAIHPDFETDEVMVALLSLRNETTPGNPLHPRFHLPLPETKRIAEKRAAYDDILRSHMIHHLTAARCLPSLHTARTVWTPSATIKAIEAGIYNTELRPNMLEDCFIRTRFGKVLSLEALCNVYVASLVNEFSALDTMCPQGFIYTYDPPSIFAYELDAEVLNRVMILALRVIVFANPLPTMQVFAFNDYADTDAIPLLVTVFSKQPHIRVVTRSTLFSDAKGHLNISFVKGAQLVIHNNSDGFG